MSDRRSLPSNATNAYPLAGGWNPQYQSGYPTSTSHYPAPCNPHPSLRTHNSLGQPAPSAYGAIMAQSSALADYQSMDRVHPYSHDRSSSMSIPQHASHPGYDRQGVPITQSSGRVHSPAQGYTNPRSQPMSHPYATTQSYPASHSPNHSSPVASMSAAQYPAQVAFSQQLDTSQYPASPQRPFSCDMCALSFNRQHDLKRHRDTHTGEKPFLCNGGCGKTFTRKDALKRHQLVKRCGIDDGA